MAVLCVSTIRASFLTHVLCIFVFRRVECRHSSFRIFLALCAMIGPQVLTVYTAADDSSCIAMIDRR